MTLAGQFVYIAGKPSVGKTHLAKECARIVHGAWVDTDMFGKWVNQSDGSLTFLVDRDLVREAGSGALRTARYPALFVSGAAWFYFEPSGLSQLHWDYIIHVLAPDLLRWRKLGEDIRTSKHKPSPEVIRRLYAGSDRSIPGEIIYNRVGEGFSPHYTILPQYSHNFETEQAYTKDAYNILRMCGYEEL